MCGEMNSPDLAVSSLNSLIFTHNSCSFYTPLKRVYRLQSTDQ